MIRFVHIFNYTDGTSLEDGEKWYLGEHVPAVRKLPGIQRYISWRAIVPPPVPYPSPGAPTPFDQFARRSELWFENYEAWEYAYKQNPSLWMHPSKVAPGFKELEHMFLEVEPQYNLLQDAPPQHYKYMTLPLWWPKGKPEIDETAEIFTDTYCISYRPDLSFADGE